MQCWLKGYKISNYQLPSYCCVFLQTSAKAKLYSVCFKCDCIFSIVKCYFYVMNHANHEVSGNVVCLFYIENSQLTLCWKFFLFEIWRRHLPTTMMSTSTSIILANKILLNKSLNGKRSHVCRKGWNNKNKNKRRRTTIKELIIFNWDNKERVYMFTS